MSLEVPGFPCAPAGPPRALEVYRGVREVRTGEESHDGTPPPGGLGAHILVGLRAGSGSFSPYDSRLNSPTEK